MSIRSTSSAPHLDDVELVRYIDREGGPAEQERWDAHLRDCGACREEADELLRQSDAISRWLAAADEAAADAAAADAAAADAAAASANVTDATDATDAAARRAAILASEPASRRTPRIGGRFRQPVWRRGPGSPWLRAAFFVLLLAAPLAAFPGVRNWVADRVVGAQSAPPPPRVAAAPEDAVSAPRIRFVPAPGTFAVVLDAVQAGGTLTVARPPAGDEAVIEMTGPGPLPEPVISARSIRIGNAAAATASYSLWLPQAVDALSVAIDGSVVQLDASDLDSGVVIPLDRRRAAP